MHDLAIFKANVIHCVNQLPPDLQPIFKDAQGKVTADKLSFQLDNGETLPLNDVESFLYGDPTTGTFPRIAEFYRKLGAKSDLLDSPQFQAMVKDVNTRFVGTPAYKDFLRTNQAVEFGNVYTTKYGDTPEGFQRYIQEYPDEVVRYIDELKKRDPNAKRSLESDSKLTQSVDELTDAVKSKTNKKAKVAAILGLGALATAVYFIVDNRRKQENGCRLVHRTDGEQGKVELLTCDDALNEAARQTSSKVRLVPTCTTQNYPNQTMVACSTETFNPCLSDAKSRAPTDQQSYPLVPDLCDKYLYRKALGSKDTSAQVQRINACGVTTKGETCSKEYCNASKFAALKDQKDLALQCYNLTWGETFVKQMLEWGEDVFCTVFPFCNNGGSPGYPTWYKYLIGVLIGGVVLYGGYRLYRTFAGRGRPSGDDGNYAFESLSLRERQRLLDRLGS